MKRSAGFTLLEIVVAIGVLGLVVLFVMGLFSQGSHVSHRTENRTRADFLAQEKLEEVLAASGESAPAPSGNFSGEFSQFQFRVSSTGSGYPGLKLVTVEVEVPTGEKVHLSAFKQTARVIMIAAGDDHSMALKDDGTVWAWGESIHGELGNGGGGAAAFSAIPVEVCDPETLNSPCSHYLSDASSIAAGSRSSYAVRDDGTLLSWGRNSSGQLGDGSQADFALPRPVTNCARCEPPNLTDVLSVSAALFGGFVLAVKNDGTVWAWGNNIFGQLGNGGLMSRQTVSTTPVEMCVEPGLTAKCDTPLSGVKAVAAGFSHSLALKKDGTVWAWGNNGWGQLGNNMGRVTTASLPVQVCGGTSLPGHCDSYLTDVIAVSAGFEHSVALKRDGTVWTWGSNFFGELGTSQQAMYSALPIQVCGSFNALSKNCKEPLANVVAVSAGFEHTLALKRDGTVWAWGSNFFGQLGNNRASPEPQVLPAQQVCLAPGSQPGGCASYLKGVIAISAGSDHNLALKSDGTIWGWGANGLGELGIGKTSARELTPIQTLKF